MDSTQGSRREAALAAVITLIVHAALAWGLSQAMRPIPPEPEDRPLQVDWVKRHPDRAVDPTPVTRDVKPDARPRRASADTAPPAPANVPDAAAAQPEAERPMSAVYLMQARQHGGDAPARAVDPLADREVALPGAGGGRFRMKPPPTGVAGVVASVGKLFGGEDAGAPCRENRRNIDELAAAGDSAALQQQLDFERRLCRP